jgi:hypothetical protein
MLLYVTQIYSYPVFFFLQESENEIVCMIDKRVREMDMNAFSCLYESERKNAIENQSR